MHLLLTDRLSCPRCGPDFGLILLADRMDGRRVLEGRLGCSNCRDAFPVTAGFGDLRPPPREPLDEPPTVTGTPPHEDTVRLAALLGVTEGPGHLALLGGTASHAGPLADLVEGIETVAVGTLLRAAPERPGVSRIAAGQALPFYSRSLRGVAVDGEGERWIAEAVRITGPGGRVVVLEGTPATREALETGGMSLILDEGGILVAGRGAPSGGVRSGGVALPVFPGPPGKAR